MRKLLGLLALGIIVSCGIGSAQNIVSLDDDKSGDADKKTDPVVISDDRQVGGWKLDGESVIVNSNKSSIVINGTCRDMTVNGGDNNIRSCKLESLTVNGSYNMITYPDSCKPKVVDNGKHNDIIARPPVHK